MKRTFAAVLLSLLVASLAGADVTRGGFVAEGFEFPTVVDLDGNGLDDLVYLQFVLLNQGSGAFVKRDFDFASDEYVIDWLDVDGDGRADLLTRSYHGVAPNLVPFPEQRIRRQIAPLQFDGGTVIVDTGDSQKVFIADVNADGKEDLMLEKVNARTPERFDAQMTVWLSRGDGTFDRKAPVAYPPHHQWSRYTRRLATGDLDHDGLPEVVVRSTNDLVVFRNRGNGVLAAQSRYLPLRFGGWETKLGDIDRDGNLDFVYASTRAVRVYFGDGKGSFNRTASVWLPQYRVPQIANPAYVSAQSNAPRSLSIGEFIAKGRTEIAGATAEGDVFFVATDGQRLKEVADRIPTEYIQPDLFIGSFRQPNRNDFLITDNYIYRAPTQPKPGLFFAEPQQLSFVGAAPAVRTSRGRAVGAPAAKPLRLSVSAQDCAQLSIATAVERDGIFASARSGDNVLDAIVDDDGLLYYRLAAKWSANGVSGFLHPAPGGGWTGGIVTSTPCGDRDLSINVQN